MERERSLIRAVISLIYVGRSRFLPVVHPNDDEVEGDSLSNVLRSKDVNEIKTPYDDLHDLMRNIVRDIYSVRRIARTYGVGNRELCVVRSQIYNKENYNRYRVHKP